jgi:hypothetical protein
MKTNRKIALGFIFTLAVLICFGMHGHLYSGILTSGVELSSGSNNVGNSVSSDIDSSDDDQISCAIESSSLVEPLSQIPVPRNLFLIQKFSLSVWQPPKIS